MKKMLLLTMAMVLVGLFLGSVALAQTTVMHGTTFFFEDGGFAVAPTTASTPYGPLAPSGGPSILLPAAALVLGTGVLTYTILRRDR
jgi:hypothetical protein